MEGLAGESGFFFLGGGGDENSAYNIRRPFLLFINVKKILTQLNPIKIFLSA